MVPEDGKAVSKSWKSRIQKDTVCPDLLEGVAFVVIDVHAAEQGSSVSENGFRSNSDTKVEKLMDFVTVVEISSLVNVLFMEFDTVFLQTKATDEINENSVPIL